MTSLAPQYVPSGKVLIAFERIRLVAKLLQIELIRLIFIYQCEE